MTCVLVALMAGGSFPFIAAGATASPASPRGSTHSPSTGSTAAAELAGARSSMASLGPTGIRRAAPSGPSWSALNQGPPSAREGSSLVWDAADKEYVLFGGLSGISYLSDTWVLSPSGDWVELHPSTVPPARAFAAMTYDTADHYVLLFGGQNFSGILSDTWKFVGGSWTRLTPTTSPSARYEASMTYDGAISEVLLFGGNGSSSLLNGTWSYHAGAWTLLHPSTAPPLREGAVFDDDPAAGAPVLFGGMGLGNVPIADTWNFSSGTWHRMATHGGPPARAEAAAGYSSSDRALLIFGGEAAVLSGIVYSDTWELVAGHWVKVSTAASPSRRLAAAGADGAGGLGMVVFGGAYVGVKGDVWAYSGGAWSTLTPAAPVYREGAMMAWDSAKKEVVLYGGVDPVSTTFYTDTWTFAGGTWTLVPAKHNPGPLEVGMMSDDPKDGYVVLFGGFAPNGTAPCGTWKFTGSNWVEVIKSCSAEPVARAAGTMTYDASDGYVLLYSGTNNSFGYTFLDTWAYAAGAWTEIFTAQSPPPLYEAEMAYDSADGYVLLYGGFNYSYLFADDSNYTWVYHAGVWTNATSIFGTQPGAQEFATLVDDPAAGYDLLFGGANPWTGAYDTVYNFTGGLWAKPVLGAPSPRVELVYGAFDPVDGYIVMFAGRTYIWTGA